MGNLEERELEDYKCKVPKKEGIYVYVDIRKASLLGGEQTIYDSIGRRV
jgi:hypothetical protein